MRITCDKWFRMFLILAVSLCLTAGLALAKNKNIEGTSTKNLTKPTASGNTVINIGALKNYFSASTSTLASGTEEQTFLIGADDLSEPSMMWDEGGYAENHYLYFSNFRMGTLNDEIRFNSISTNDWTVIQNDPNQVAPYIVNFSMTDEFAGSLSRNITASQTVYAWSESYRDDFFILEYNITNTGSNDYTDFYAWLVADCDISAPAGGSDAQGFWRDDVVDFYVGTDANGQAETISYMYDGDNPNITGDDTGGLRTPKESMGYLGSRILESPAIVGDETGATANQQSGHQWWDWNSDPDVGGGFYNKAILREFKTRPGSPHDYRYMQVVGPLALAGGETIKIVLASGIGEGLDGLRANLQWAYDLYWNDWQGPAAPQAPNMTLTSGDGFAKVTWDSVSEHSRDPLTGEIEFEGYRLYRSLDKSAWTVLGEWDLIDDIGANTGLPPFNGDGLYEYVDTDVTNGYLYYYTVTSYDKGTADLPSLENGKSVDNSTQPGPPSTGNVVNEDQIRVVPNPFVVKAPWDFTPTRDNPAEERIQFQGIPDNSKITVFNLAGDMIIELNQEGNEGWVDWDLITRNRQKIVSGLYLYVVEPPEGDNFIGKFVVVR